MRPLLIELGVVGVQATARTLPKKKMSISFKRLASVALLAGSSVFSHLAFAANTYTVTNTLDSGPGSLREAVTNANSDGVDSVIVFASSANGTIVLTTGASANSALRLTNDGMLTITGNGASNTLLSANSALRHMEIASSARVVLNSLTLKDGRQGGGGAIYNEGNLTINESTLRDNTSLTSAGGGAIFSTNITSSLDISGSLFSNNRAEQGGAIDVEGMSLNVGNSKFEDNSASYGGAIFIRSGTANILASLFTGNSSTFSGGAIFNNSSINIINSIFILSTAAGNGGAIYTQTVGDTTVISSTLSHNVAGFGGGFFNKGLLSVRNSVIANNTDKFSGNPDCIRETGIIHAQFSLMGSGLSCVNGTSSGNLTGDPGLDVAYTPTNVSQVINSGDNSLIPVGTSTDLAGAARIQQGKVDMGAFESPYLPAQTVTGIATPAAGGTVTCTPNPVSHGGSASCTQASNAGYTFTSWSGDCTGIGACNLTNVTSAKAVTANYSAITYTITSVASPAAGGTVTCTPNPVSHGSSVSCTQTPNAGYTFTGWSGSCSGTGACNLTNVTSAKAVTANYSAINYTITSAASPAAGGTVTCTPNPVSHGSSVSCTQTPNAGYTFTSWSGACNGASGTCTLANVSSALAMTAQFTPQVNAPAAIPTLSEWALLLLVGLVIWQAWALQRKRTG